MPLRYLDVAVMGEDQRGGRPAAEDADDFEWVNAWARKDALAPASENDPAPATEADNVHVLRAAFAADALRAASALDAASDDDQLRRDIAAVEQARDALAAAGQPFVDRRKARPGISFQLRRTSDRVPVILGSVLGMLMLMVFTAAASFVKLAR